MPQYLISSLIASLDAETMNLIVTEKAIRGEKVIDGFRAAVAAILGGIVKQADDPDAMRRVFELAGNAASEGREFSGAWNQHGESLKEPRQRLLSTIFETNQSAVVLAIGYRTKLASGVVAELMDVAAQKVLWHLGARIQSQGTSLGGFQNLLFREVGDLSVYLPASIQNLLPTPTPLRQSVPAVEAPVMTERTGNRRRVLALVLIAAVALGIIWMIQRSSADDQAGDASRSRARFSPLGEFVERELPGGISLSIPANGMESKLISHLEDKTQNDSQYAGREQWFDFDRVAFETNSAIPKPESEEQLMNLASILKAYPQVRLKVGGYTDNSGSRRANERLSENRAESIRRELVVMGIAYNRVEAEGFGDQHPIADNATEQGRAKNRRISVRVLQK